ncbi:MAG: hypothetical protein KBD78_01825 [Oligoflexales bacterium]|nr:hypothetical protein [Oligoflexales bacterium]
MNIRFMSSICGIFMILFFCFEAIAKEEIRLIYGETAKISSYDSYTSHELAAQRLADLIYDSLIVLGPGASYMPQLAKSWKATKDNLSVEFELREDVYWHSKLENKKFSARDVVATVEAILNRNSQIPSAERFRVIKNAEILGTNGVKINLHWPMYDPLSLLTFKILPADLLGEKPQLLRNSALAQHPVGTGSYEFDRATKSGEVYLRKNPRYYDSAPKIDNLVLKMFTDKEIMSQALMFNSIDLVTSASPSRIAEIEADANLKTHVYDSLSYSFIALNTKRSILSRKEVRQAINMAISREEMLEAFFQNNGHLITGPFPPTSWAYNIDVKPYKYDALAARAKLESQGLKDKDGDGYYEDQTGKKINLSFLVPVSGESESVKKIVLAIKSYLKDVGLDCNVSFLDWNVWKEKVLANHDYDMALGAWSFDDSSNITSLFHSSMAVEWGNNFTLFQNQEVDSLLAESSATFDLEKKRIINQKLHALISEEAPYVFLWSLKDHVAYTNKLSGFQMRGQSIFNSIAKWKKM